MIEVIVLSFVLSKEPIKCRRTDEHDQVVCFNSNPTGNAIVPNLVSDVQYATVIGSSEQRTILITDFFPKEDFALLTVDERFHRLSAQWSKETANVSSVTRTVADPTYQAIIKLGWDVVPLLLNDLKDNQGFWYPALNAITGIRPFDLKDAGNARRMTKAWVAWGQKKGLL